jgi:hypothetical protein
VLRLVIGFALTVFMGAFGVTMGAALMNQGPLSPAPVAPSDPTAEPAATLPRADVSPHNLPNWVQTRQIATLWSGPDQQAVEFTRLPAWTFLKVDGAQDSRLRVEYAGDGGSRQAGPGWVAIGDVQPSDPSGAWVRSFHATQLFSDSTGPDAVAAILKWTWMLRLDGAADGRLKVRAYAGSFSSKLGEGWVPAADVGPAGAPAQSVFSGADVRAGSNPYPSHDAFITAVAAAASANPSTVPVSVTVAQAALESSWGESILSRQAHNYFGIKAIGEIGNDGAVWMRALEYVPGGSYNVVAPFRAYKTLADSVADHARFLNQDDRFRDALPVARDADEFARRIAKDGYNSDPNYASKLIDLMHQYDLYRLDNPSRQTTLV